MIIVRKFFTYSPFPFLIKTAESVDHKIKGFFTKPFRFNSVAKVPKSNPSPSFLEKSFSFGRRLTTTALEKQLGFGL